MKVLHVLDRSLPVVAGYTTRAAAIVAEQAALGLEAEVLTSPRQTSPAGPIEGTYHHRTMAPTSRRELRRIPGYRELGEVVATGRRILELHDAAPVDVIHAHSPVLWGIAGFASSRARRSARVASVYEVRALWEDAAEEQGKAGRGSARYRAVRAAESALCRVADAVVVLCEGLRGELLDRGVPSDRLFVVPNGVDTARFTPRPRDEAMAARLGLTGKRVVAYVGSLFRFEGVTRLLGVLRRLTDRREDVRGLIAGSGEALAEVRAEVARLGLEGKVVVAGKVPPADVPALYSVADVLVYPREPSRLTDLVTPLKPLEAMSMGKVVVGSDVGGLRELITDGETGLLFRAGDGVDLERALERALDDAGLQRRLGLDGRAHVVRSRDWRALAARYLPIYAAAREARSRWGVR